MRVFVVGGTGFLGWHTVRSCLARGWKATVLGLPPGPPKGLFARGVRVLSGNLDDLSDARLRSMLRGHDALVFAAGMDERSTPPRPVYPKLRKANVDDLQRVLTLARDAGATRGVVVGSYFAHFARHWSELQLGSHHPYIRSRLEQERVARSVPGMAGMVVQLPYVFGALPVEGWQPLWAPLVRYLRQSGRLYYPDGGSACISATVAGEAIAAAIERGKAGRRYPIGQENLDWSELLMRLALANGRQVRVHTLPARLTRFGFQAGHWWNRLQGKESGLDLPRFAELQMERLFIDPVPSQRALGYALDDLDEALRATVAAVVQ